MRGHLGIVPPPIPLEVKISILRKHFEGYENEEIPHGRTKGGGTVTNVLKEFESEAMVDWEDTLDKYEVRDLLENLYDLSKVLKEADVAPEDAIEGAELASTLKEAGVTQGQTESFLKKLVRQESKYSVEEIVKGAAELYDLERDYKKKYRTLLHDFKDKGEEYKKLEDSVEELGRQKREVAAELDKTLHGNETTRTDLKQFVEARGTLQRCGVTVDDLPKVGRIIVNMKEEGFDVKKVIESFSQEQSLKVRTASAQSELAALESRKAPLEEARELYERLTSYGFSIEYMSALAKIASHYKEPAKFASEVAQAYQEYGQLLGLMGKLHGLQEEMAIMELSRQREEEKSKLSRAAIASMLELKNKGIKENEIVLRDEVIKQYKTTEETLEAISRLMKLDNLSQLIDEKTAKLREVEGHVVQAIANMEALESRMDSLEDQLGRLPQALATAEKNIVSTQESYTKKAEEMVRKAVEAGRLSQELVQKYESRKQFIDLATFFDKPSEGDRAFVKPFTLDYLDKMEKWAAVAKGVTNAYGLQIDIRGFRKSVEKDA